MAKVIVFSGNSGVSICYPAQDANIQDVLMKDCPPTAVIIDADDLPKYPEYSRAWVIEDGKVSVDMTRARDVHRDKLREARDPLFIPLDKEWIIADERGDDAQKAIIRSKKTALRNVTSDPAIEKAKTLEDLVQVWPNCLK